MCARARARVLTCMHVCACVKEREGKKVRETERMCEKEREKWGGGGGETHREDRKTEKKLRETDRQTQREGHIKKSKRHRERVREGERARKNMLGTYYATKCTIRCME